MAICRIHGSYYADEYGSCRDCLAQSNDNQRLLQRMAEAAEQAARPAPSGPGMGLCRCCGQMFVESVRVTLEHFTEWFGILASYEKEGVCPRCFNEGRLRNEVRGWTQDRWHRFHEESVTALTSVHGATKLRDELRSTFPDLAQKVEAWLKRNVITAELLAESVETSVVETYADTEVRSVEEIFWEDVVVKPATWYRREVRESAGRMRTVEKTVPVTRMRTVQRTTHRLRVVVRNGEGAVVSDQPIVFVPIPAGRFWMGSPDNEPDRQSNETRHEVVLTRAFEMQATPVTQGQWTALMGNSPSYFTGADRPVETVSFLDALAYCNALSRAIGVEEAYVLSSVHGKPGEEGFKASVHWKGLDCKGFRLPTEAEWEYACRAGSTGARYGALDAVAWYDSNSGLETHPVGQKAANAWGLHDTLGNVWEWCWDWYGAEYPSGLVTDPTGPATSPSRVNRGGSRSDRAKHVRAASRGFSGSLGNDCGFRIARSGL